MQLIVMSYDINYLSVHNYINAVPIPAIYFHIQFKLHFIF